MPSSQRDARSSNPTRKSSGHGDRGSGNRSSHRDNNSSSGRHFMPPDPRPSRAHPEERQNRRSKENECGGFGWTPGIVLALVGATALFSVDKSLFRRRKKDVFGESLL